MNYKLHDKIVVNAKKFMGGEAYAIRALVDYLMADHYTVAKDEVFQAAVDFWKEIGVLSSMHGTLNVQFIQYPKVNTEDALHMFVKDNVQRYRNIFKGVKTNSMGSKQDCIKKLYMFMKKNPTVDFDLILKCAERHVSLHEAQFTSQAGYYIHKNGDSKLASDLETIEDDKEFQSTFKRLI